VQHLLSSIVAFAAIVFLVYAVLKPAKNVTVHVHPVLDIGDFATAPAAVEAVATAEPPPPMSATVGGIPPHDVPKE
jgi:hypothetical protein